MTSEGFFERTAALVEMLFEAPGDPRAWERLMAALARSLSKGAVPMVLGLISDDDSPPFLIGHGMPMRRLSRADLQPDEDHPPPERASVGGLFEIPPASEGFERTNLYQNVFSKEGLAPGPGLLAILSRGARQITGGLMVLSRDPEWRPTDDDRALVELLAPYLIRGVMLGLRLNERRISIDALLGVFDSLVLGVVLLDAHGNVSFANQSAADLLGTTAGLTRPGRAHAAEQRKRTEALRALIRREMGGSGGALTYPHPDDGRPLFITSTPLSWGGANVLPDARFATALFLGDPGCVATPGTVRALGKLYGLTPAEERLALALASGKTLAESSLALGIRLSTARGVLRAVFEKTGTNRQSNLVRLVLTTVGQVRPEPPRG